MWERIPIRIPQINTLKLDRSNIIQNNLVLNLVYILEYKHLDAQLVDFYCNFSLWTIERIKHLKIKFFSLLMI